MYPVRHPTVGQSFVKPSVDFNRLVPNTSAAIAAIRNTYGMGTGNHAGSGGACIALPLPAVPIYEYMMTPRTFSAFRIAS